MGVFGNEDYVDYTLLKKRGLLKENNQEIKSESSNSSFVDFTAGFSQANNANSSPQTSTGNPFDLLSSLTSSSSAVSSNVSESSSSPISNYPSNSSEDVNALKLKIEDLEYKLQRLIERIDGMNSSK